MSRRLNLVTLCLSTVLCDHGLDGAINAVPFPSAEKPSIMRGEDSSFSARSSRKEGMTVVSPIHHVNLSPSCSPPLFVVIIQMGALSHRNLRKEKQQPRSNLNICEHNQVSTLFQLQLGHREKIVSFPSMVIGVLES